MREGGKKSRSMRRREGRSECGEGDGREDGIGGMKGREGREKRGKRELPFVMLQYMSVT